MYAINAERDYLRGVRIVGGHANQPNPACALTLGQVSQNNAAKITSPSTVIVPKMSPSEGRRPGWDQPGSAEHSVDDPKKSGRTRHDAGPCCAAEL